MWHPRLAVLLASIALPVGALPAGATAATVRVHPAFNKAEHTGDSVVYQGLPGERNEVSVTRDGPTVVVTDVVPIDPGSGCASEGTTRARCSPSHWSVGMAIRLGDRDDSVRLGPGSGGRLWGGPGDDVLLGAPDQSNGFHGGAGDDTMVGGGASDSFHEGAARSGSDTMIGGSDGSARPEHDWVDYGRRRAALHVDLQGDADDGEGGERDRVGRDVEDVQGGSGPDRLQGGPDRNWLDGSAGRDTLHGGGGADSLTGDTLVVKGAPRSADRLFGGPGDDEIRAGTGADVVAAGPGLDRVDAGHGADRLRLSDGGPDVARCGRGRDFADQDRHDFLARGCERRGARQAPFAMPFLWVDASDMLTLELACPSDRTLPCQGELSVDPGPPVPRGTSAFELQPGSIGFVYVPLQGRTYENRVPPLDGAVLELSSTDARGHMVSARVALRDLVDANP
jgi:RTX calcium-binding nonapeptide repeat (4 copies)